MAAITLRLSVCNKSTEVEKLLFAFKNPHLAEIGQMAEVAKLANAMPPTSNTSVS